MRGKLWALAFTAGLVVGACSGSDDADSPPTRLPPDSSFPSSTRPGVSSITSQADTTAANTTQAPTTTRAPATTHAPTTIATKETLALRPDGLGPLDFGAAADDVIGLLEPVLGTPDHADRSGTGGEVLTWPEVGLEIEISTDGGRTPGGGGLSLLEPAFTAWTVAGEANEPALRTREAIAVGSGVGALCTAYAIDCDTVRAPGLEVFFAPDRFPWDHSRPAMWFGLAEPGNGELEVTAIHASLRGGWVADYQAELERLRFRQRMTGAWAGTVVTPWIEPYSVQVDFDASGRFTARQTGAPAIFFYGTDEVIDSELARRWEVIEVAADETGRGWLSVLLDPADPFAVSEGGLTGIALSADGRLLEFDFWADWEEDPGPMHFELSR